MVGAPCYARLKLIEPARWKPKIGIISAGCPHPRTARLNDDIWDLLLRRLNTFKGSEYDIAHDDSAWIGLGDVVELAHERPRAVRRGGR